MYKKKIIISFVALLIAVIGFLSFFGDDMEEYFKYKTFQRLFALEKDYSLQSESGGVYLVNERDGFKVRLPDNWKLATGTDSINFYLDKGVALSSSDFNLRPPEGCIITIQITRAENEKEKSGFAIQTAEEVSKLIELRREERKLNEYPSREILVIDGRDSLKEVYPPQEGAIMAEYSHIDIPAYNRVYSFDLASYSVKCKKEFDNLLETISIQI